MAFHIFYNSPLRILPRMVLQLHTLYYSARIVETELWLMFREIIGPMKPVVIAFRGAHDHVDDCM